MSEPQQPTRRWRVTVTEWLSHVALIDAATAEEGEAQARELWAENAEHELSDSASPVPMASWSMRREPVYPAGKERSAGCYRGCRSNTVTDLL